MQVYFRHVMRPESDEILIDGMHEVRVEQCKRDFYKEKRNDGVSRNVHDSGDR